MTSAALPVQLQHQLLLLFLSLSLWLVCLFFLLFFPQHLTFQQTSAHPSCLLRPYRLSQCRLISGFTPPLLCRRSSLSNFLRTKCVTSLFLSLFPSAALSLLMLDQWVGSADSKENDWLQLCPLTVWSQDIISRCATEAEWRPWPSHVRGHWSFTVYFLSLFGLRLFF